MTVGSHRLRWVAAVPMSALVAAFTLAELSDLVTAQMVRRELNPIAASLSATPLLSFALKVALIAFVVATAVICERERPGVARLVLVIGMIAGVVGALSNTHLTPI
jgi:ABC-type xylose transport system permease subunit